MEELRTFCGTLDHGNTLLGFHSVIEIALYMYFNLNSFLRLYAYIKVCVLTMISLILCLLFRPSLFHLHPSCYHLRLHQHFR
jgi:hypothetical protein